jgi:hypothetical protein
LLFRYNVCIRPESGSCCVKYQACADQPDAYSLSSGDSAITMAKLDTNCALDYVLIDGEM